LFVIVIIFVYVKILVKLLYGEKPFNLKSNMNDPTLIWFLIGIGLLFLEFAAPGLVILFFGIGGLITSLTSYLEITDNLQSQLLTFCIASVLSLILLRKFLKTWFVGNSENETDEMRTEFIGKTVKVTSDIPDGPGLGKVELKGADWNAKSDRSHAEGDMVTVVERDGLTLTVE